MQWRQRRARTYAVSRFFASFVTWRLGSCACFVAAEVGYQLLHIFDFSARQRPKGGGNKLSRERREQGVAGQRCACGA